MKRINAVRQTLRNHLRDPLRMKLPVGYSIRARSPNKNGITTMLMYGDKSLAYMNLDFSPYGKDKVMMTFEGGTYPNIRRQGMGTLLRALITKAALNSGVNNIHHMGINIELLAAKKLAMNESISLNNAKARNPMPLSTKIVRKLGYAPRKEHNGIYQSYMTPYMNRAKLNNSIKYLTSALNR